MNKKIVIIGGGTVNHVRAHLALAAVSYGTTAKQLHELCLKRFDNLDVELVLTRMAGGPDIETNDDLLKYVDTLISDNTVKCIIFNAAVADFKGHIPGEQSGKYASRLKTSDGVTSMVMCPADKIIGRIRSLRKDIFVVGFKATAGQNESTQFKAGLSMLKRNSVNVVLANDTVTRNNMLITPEEGVYKFRTDRASALESLVDMIYYRTHLTFTRSTVIEGKPVPWNDNRVYDSLRDVVNWCVAKNAYKTFRGVTTGHFAAKLAHDTFLTSIRKTNFNDIASNGMVLVRTDGDDSVIAYGTKPSVGGQSQRYIFEKFPELDCIVHFHCPLRVDRVDDIPAVSQFEYECGSHQCGENTANGLAQFGNLYAVMLDMHGPNIVFSHNIDPNEVIAFIERNFDLSRPTNGFNSVYLPFN